MFVVLVLLLLPRAVALANKLVTYVLKLKRYVAKGHTNTSVLNPLTVTLISRVMISPASSPRLSVLSNS